MMRCAVCWQNLELLQVKHFNGALTDLRTPRRQPPEVKGRETHQDKTGEGKGSNAMLNLEENSPNL